MKQSRLFYKSLKTIPRDATTISHQNLLRAGYIDQIAAGRYAFLPLGYLVWENIIRVIDEEMRFIESQRVNTPTLHPIEIWQQTNRDKAFGGEMLIVEDHHGATFAIGATAEGLMTELIKSKKPSYKELPIVIHQFVQKFRDEKRPRGGLLRVREFMMKDAYSFHATEEDLLEWYDVFFKAYLKIAERFDLDVTPVVADSGAIGGDYNHEFMVESESGEDTILKCNECDYAANEEKAESEFETYEQDKEIKERRDVEGKGIIGVEKLSDFLKIPVHVTTKTLIYQTDSGEVVAAMVRGDYDINELKLKSTLNATTVELASEETVKEITGAEVGYAGPIGLPDSVKIIADFTCKDRVNFEAGANKTDYHSLNINFERDFKTPEFVDIRQVKPGDKCSKCSKGKLIAKRTIEWGHTFHQGQFYAKPHEAVFVDDNNQEQTIWQGAYGIGIGRTMATIVETHNDEHGIIWPKSVTPYQVHLLEVGGENTQKAEEVYKALQNAGFSVLYDDRQMRPGEKFAEADLIGISVRLVISKRNGDNIELKERAKDESVLMDQNELTDWLKDYYRAC